MSRQWDIVDNSFRFDIIDLHLWWGYIINLIHRNMTVQKEKTFINFKKAQSLISTIIKLIETDRYCIDIMQQNLAVLGLLKSAHKMLMENHLKTCFKSAMESKNKRRKQKMTREILKVTSLFNK